MPLYWGASRALPAPRRMSTWASAPSTPDFPLDVVGTINSSTGFSLGEIGFAFGTYGNQNAFVGFAGNTAMTGGGNTADGALALFNNAAGTNNTAVGANALPGNTDGNNNSAIGFNAGALRMAF